MTRFLQSYNIVLTGIFVFLLLLTLSALSACSAVFSKPGLESRLLAGSSVELGSAFHHVVLSKSAHKIAQSALRIYIEGDGKPFINRTSVARDPTPRYAPVLALWKLDPGDAVYIGRPCYLGLAELPECNARVWTTGRYSGQVVESMQSVAQRYSDERPIVLIGHSGGGALAMLMADRMSKASEWGIAENLAEIAAIVTLSGNLDVSGWTKLHGYTALNQSESPADKLPLAEHIAQLHVVAGRDSTIPPYLTRKLENRLPAHSICEVAAYDHNCCWNHRWVEFLTALETQLLSGEVDPVAVCTVF